MTNRIGVDANNECVAIGMRVRKRYPRVTRLLKTHATKCAANREIAPVRLENPFIAIVGGGGDNQSPTRNIRNSISLTMMRSHRIICVLN
ncbi:hypothetical protein [Bradyrhizobium sp. ARR65]|uniref:hypothetical protein n=1 Tax=Bradyrhizobium sp. ARR65 TaxID=1040989 RepID=UPI0012FC9F80|nr:hypothetical protein [Bradyrhizobium sp. ARR65]